MKFPFWKQLLDSPAVQTLEKMPSWQLSAKQDEADYSLCDCGRQGVRVVCLLDHSYAVCSNDTCLQKAAQKQRKDVQEMNPNQRIKALDGSI